MLLRKLRERLRRRAVERLGALDTLAEAGFDRFVEQAAHAFAAPLVLLNLLRDDELWVKAGIGLPVGCYARRDSFCTMSVDRDDLYEVCDALADPLCRSLPAVQGAPHVRYYIGAPLRLGTGVDVGVLCVLDTRPRPPASRDQRAYLVGLARQATDALERHAHIKGSLAA